MDWVKEPLNRRAARGLRAATRRCPEVDGHRFTYNDLKELWASTNGAHLLCLHDSDPVWQHWHHSTEGWTLVGVYTNRMKAQVGAAQIKSPSPVVEAGTYLVAKMGQGRPIRIRCGTAGRLTTIEEIYQKLGYDTSVEEVA
jgi:hypothetical protein